MGHPILKMDLVPSCNKQLAEFTQQVSMRMETLHETFFSQFSHSKVGVQTSHKGRSYTSKYVNS